jgi:hypothetical protein
MTLEEAYCGRKPNISHLRVFRLLVYTHILQKTHEKLDNSTIPTCLVGYMLTSCQYRLYEPIRRDIIVLTVPTFRENECLQHKWDDQEAGELVIPFDPMCTPEWDDDIPNEVDCDRGVDELSEHLRGSSNLNLTTTLPPRASRALGANIIVEESERGPQNQPENQSIQPELNELGADEHVEPGDHYKRSNPDKYVDLGDRLLRSSPNKTVDLGDAGLLQANPNELESLETLVNSETIKVNVDSVANDKVEDKDDTADTELRRSSYTYRLNT